MNATTCHPEAALILGCSIGLIVCALALFVMYRNLRKGAEKATRELNEATERHHRTLRGYRK